MEKITEAQNNLAKEVINTVSSDWYVKIVNPTTGEEKLISLKNHAAMSLNLCPWQKDGAFIMYHRKSDDFPLAVPYSSWPSLQNSGEIADGVLIIRGDKHIVVAPTEASLYWSKGTGTATATTSDRLVAMSDWEGKSKTAAIVANAAFKDDGAGYAPGYCNAYSRTNANGAGLTAGKWWLPSVAELVMMWSNFEIINEGLKLITGATLLQRTWYWSSTEGSASNAWILGFSSGTLGSWGNKVSNQSQVRAVSAFIG